MKRKVTFILNTQKEDLSSLKRPDDEDEPDEEPPPKKQTKTFIPEPEETDEEEEPIPQSEDIVSKELLTLRKTIKLYIDWFPTKLKEFQSLDVDTISTITGAKDVIDRIKFQISATNNASFNKMFLQGGIGIVENVGSIIGFNIQGLSVVASNDPEIDDILKEIALDGIEKGWTIQNPYTKLAAVLLFQAARLHNFNTQQEIMCKLRTTIVPEEVVNKFKDL
jgi:hypothetical protein